jgi:3-oxoacyl-[acyl-carrier-protein] synthase-1
MLLAENKQGALIPNINDDDIDDGLAPLNWVKKGADLGRDIRVCQSNSFAFGGNNVSIVVARA